MITRIASEQLRVGMYVHHLECAWMAHPFLNNQFKITQASDIAKIIQHGIRHVSIDTSRGIGLDSAEPPMPQDSGEAAAADRENPGISSPPAESVEMDLLLSDIDATPFPTPEPTPLHEELKVARQILGEAHALMADVMNDARLGRMVKLEQMEPVVENMIQSVLRNPGALSCLGRVRQKDHYTFEHSINVSVLLVNFCHHLGHSRRTIREAAIGGLLHDVGKVHTPDAILNKPGPLNDEEFAQIRAHVGHGVDIVADIADVSDQTLAIVAQHHEHLDGSGYPAGLSGNQISQLGQMVAIVDVYEALTSNRPYRAAIEPAVALQRIFGWSTQQFNNELVQRFIQCVGIYPVGTLVMLDSGMLAIVTETHRGNLLRPSVRIVLDSRRDQVVTPRELNLAKPGVKERIVSAESPARWKINMGLHLG